MIGVDNDSDGDTDEEHAIEDEIIQKLNQQKGIHSYMLNIKRIQGYFFFQIMKIGCVVFISVNFAGDFLMLQQFSFLISLGATKSCLILGFMVETGSN